VCVCVAVSSWVCRGIVNRLMRLVRSGVWGLVPRCMYQRLLCTGTVKSLKWFSRVRLQV